MAKEKLVLNAELNFILQVKGTGCATDYVTKMTCDFYKVEDIVEAKKILWALAKSTQPHRYCSSIQFV